MTPENLATRIDNIVTQALSVFDKQVTKTQRELFNQLELMLKKLDLDGDGYILQNARNRKILSQFGTTFEKAFRSSGYYESLNELPKAVAGISEETAAYFNFLKSGFTIDARYLKSLQLQTISQLEGMLANEGLELMVKQPILEILNQNINTGAAYRDMLTQVRSFVLGDAELQGKLQRYAGQITSDTLFNFSRGLQTAISAAANLEFVMYLGGLVKDSRDFCIERSNKFFHRKEVESWADEEWAGKRNGTTPSTIFIYAGGYRCQHQIIAVSEAIVPSEVIERAKLKGYASR